MNQLIRELAEQAKFMVEEDINRQISYNTELKAFAEKFAELIVEQVYDYILNATFDDEPWPSRKDVKQHFGVER